MSGLALSLLTACASSTPNGKAETAEAQEIAFAKPTADEIRQISLTSPLEQAGFWLQQYNKHPTDLDISLAYITALLRINSYEEAAEVAKFTSVSFPNSQQTWSLLGKAYNKIDKPIEAVKAYGKVIELDPNNAAPLAAMGAIFDSRGDHETAQIAYERALKLDPNRPFTLTNYGLSLSLVGKLGQAEEVLKRASDLPAATAAVRQNYALILGLQGKFDQAREVAAIDAPDGLADRNTVFLQRMIGENPQLKAIAAKAQSQPVQASISQAPAETPEAAPTADITSTALPEIQVASLERETTPEPDANTVERPAATEATNPLALRTRRRSSPTGD